MLRTCLSFAFPTVLLAVLLCTPADGRLLLTAAATHPVAHALHVASDGTRADRLRGVPLTSEFVYMVQCCGRVELPMVAALYVMLPSVSSSILAMPLLPPFAVFSRHQVSQTCCAGASKTPVAASMAQSITVMLAHMQGVH